MIKVEMTPISPLQPPIPRSIDNRLQWGNLKGDSVSLAISTLAEKNQGPLLLITPDVHSANYLHRSLPFFSSADTPILHFPDWETLPYDYFSPHEDIISERLLTLYRLPRLSSGIIISALPTLLQRLPPADHLEKNTFILSVGEKFSLQENRERLISAGYRSVQQVMEHGEYAQRGSIIDIYPMGSPLPYRIELFDDEVTSIRSFDPESQRSVEKIESVRLLPAREYPLTKEAITHFRQSWRAKFLGNPQEAPIYQQISEGEAAAGIEYYLPLFFETTQTFFSYLPKNTTVILFEKLETVAHQFWQEVEHRYEQLRHDLTRPLCPPSELFLSFEQLRIEIKNHTQIKISDAPIIGKTGQVNFATENFPPLLIDHKASQPFARLKNFLHEITAIQGGRVLFCAETDGRRETLLEFLKEIDTTPQAVKNWRTFLAENTRVGLTIAPLDKGVLLSSPPLAIISESQLFGEQIRQRRLEKERKIDPNLLIRNLTELHIGDPVVHIQHGVGRYLGLQTIKTSDQEAEYLTLQYADNDKIYVPVSSLYLISRYAGADASHAPLQKLGSKQWEKIKEKTQKHIRDVAAELLDIYSRRQAATGFTFSIPEKEYSLFRQAFPFEETPDQSAAINDVIVDMSSKRSMDRLICGDVGFGKTEVAMQAAFIAVQNNKQVAVLVPTTLLAEQHFYNFQDRFADWPVRIAAISRLRTQKQRQQITQELAEGKIDIIIGTHKLLSKDIRFKDLGLLIVDEEHRFGVTQKERIKSLRAHVDILTLTATPIPRTLNMSLSGIRDLSLITTPPAKRLSVKTFVHDYSPVLIREAILRENLRGGQVYFLHNDVATLAATAEKLRTIIPEARLAIAHGQMRERDLERVMSDFYHQKYNLLVCTTIIESGIDIPTANTIIINRADRFGLAQLHQLRGRVGRSHHQAYAYLLIPDQEALTADAEKRLSAISQLDDLGVGFNLATHDLEIRGAGELLGVEQSGQIHDIGFSLYLELLEEAVSALKAGREPQFEKPLHAVSEIDLGITTLLPEDYVPDVNARLILYKRLANCKNKREIQALKEELIDRFGPLPPAAQHLLQSAELRLIANELGIQKINIGSKYGYFHFDKKPAIDLTKLIKLVQTQPQRYQLQGDESLRFILSNPTPQSKLETIYELIKNLK
ncbi:transcription-repair coupling factor [Coxiella burnetii]|uniref:transcription-repair coupling factor n=1 Tax=Coxiella burnetii TaxID=777 RepID=UPI000CCC7005|nr:transcription-repair coupling factor [Coxiella burnetii]PNT88739.1 transcription-repair coupling factor [Coxiella burnetii]